MKIGLLTYHAVCNFGANLQALSTVSYWRNRGHDPIFINWITEELDNHYHRITPESQYYEHENFRKKFFPMTRRCITDNDIVDVIREEGIEAVVIGSDAVMQTRPLRARIAFPTREILTISKPARDLICPNPFWGSFVHLLEKKIPICYMSASCQNSKFRSSNSKEKGEAKALLKQFSYISTRDDWTAKQVSWFTDGELIPPVTPDPVFAFNLNVKSQPSEQEIRDRFNLHGNYCLFSFHSDSAVSQKWLQEMQSRMQKRGVMCVALPFPQGMEFHHPFNKEIKLPLSPLDWYALIKYANYYIGDNMHPIVVSLHNAVPCFSFDQYATVKFHFIVNSSSSKVYHILKQFGYPDNRVSLKGLYRMPSVDYVLQKLDVFDKDYVRTVAAHYVEEYLKMMQDIEFVISNN